MESQIAEFLKVIFEQLNSLTLIPYAVPLVIILVSLTKRIPQLAGVDGKVLQLFWQVMFWAAAGLLIHFGKGDNLQQWTELIITFAKMLLPGAVSLAAATRGYQYAVNHNVPLLGFKRTQRMG